VRAACFLKQVNKKEEIEPSEVVVHLSSCIASDNYHGPPCPHEDYLRRIIEGKLGLALREMTVVSKVAQKRSEEKLYAGS
jgi:predicted metal-binding protein